MNPVFETLTTFAGEAIRLIGWNRIALGVGAMVASAALTGWIGARLLARDGKPFMSALCSSLFVVLTAAFVGAGYAALTVMAMLNSGGSSAAPGLNYACLGIGGGLILIGVHGAFGTPLWKSAILLPVVLAGAVGAGFAVVPLVFPGQAAQLQQLANQVTGKTSDGPWLVTSPTATRKIELRRAESDREKLLLEQRNLAKPYQELQATRAKLNANDPAAVSAFNARAEAYAAEVKRIRERLAAIQTLQDSETALETKALQDADESEDKE